jgi:cellulose synthase/poly-beta-1,6-N-acetylglucosamine synthase-like glycosyltransferase
MKVLFWGSLFMLLYIYLGYPALVLLIASVRNRPIKKGHYLPHVTILIAAHNEEESIEATLKNKLSLDYPREKLEIIVVSDNSIDQTDEIVKKYEHKNVKLLKQTPRAGKTAALNIAVPQARGEILIFSDANSIYESKALRMLVQNFSDPTVGYVTGKMIYINPNGTTIGDGCTRYMKYENFLRMYETRIGSVAGVDGGIDAVRRELYQPMNHDQLPDLVLPLKVVEKGYRVIYEPKAVLKEAALQFANDEYRMRVRVALRAIWAIRDMKHLLSYKKYKIFAWELLSHKVLRYLSFVFLLGLYLSNLFLWGQNEYFKILFLLQNAFYLSVILAFILEKNSKHLKLLSVPYFFTVTNLASAYAFIKCSLGQKQQIWMPRRGN